MSRTCPKSRFFSSILISFIFFHFSFILYFRLFIVAGIAWIMEIVWFVVPFNSTIYFLADLFNSLQGVFIFVLFVLKPRVLRLIKKRFVLLNRIDSIELISQLIVQTRWNQLRGQTIPNESTVSKTNDADDYLRLNSVAIPE